MKNSTSTLPASSFCLKLKPEKGDQKRVEGLLLPARRVRTSWETEISLSSAHRWDARAASVGAAQDSVKLDAVSGSDSQIGCLNR
jgi:hypothetical protein